MVRKYLNYINAYLTTIYKLNLTLKERINLEKIMNGINTLGSLLSMISMRLTKM